MKINIKKLLSTAEKYILNGKLEEAKQVYSSLEQVLSPTEELLLIQASTYLNNNFLTEADKILKRILNLNQSNQQATFLLTSLHVKMGTFFIIIHDNHSYLIQNPLAFTPPLQLKNSTHNQIDSLFSGIYLAIQEKNFEAFETLYTWGSKDLPLPQYNFTSGSLTINYDQEIRILSTESKIILLKEIAKTFPKESHPSETLTISIGRLLSNIDKNDEAVSYVENNLPETPSFFAASSPIALKKKKLGHNVPDSLAHYTFDNTGFLKQRFCHDPFANMIVTYTGNVKTCCGAFMEKSIGNIETNTADAIWNSDKAIELRQTILDGSFRHCNLSKCHNVIKDSLALKKDFPNAYNALMTTNENTIAPQNISYAGDPSCNLYCRSCRDKRFMIGKDKIKKAIEGIETSIIPLLPNTKTLQLNSSGEVFASVPSMYLLSKINRQEHSQLKIHLISNGTLFSEKRWKSISNIHGLVNSVRISTDSFKKETFETLRRGANYETFMKNIKFLSKLRSEGEIQLLMLSFTYQLLNFREMESFATMASDLGCDFVVFEKLDIFGWHFSTQWTKEQFLKEAVHLPDHPLHQDFLNCLNSSFFSNPLVRSSDFAGISR